MKFAKEFLVELVWGDHEDNVEIIQDEITGKSRWCDIHEIIFKIDEKFYSADYRIGSTENCDERPFEYDDDEIECEEVEPYEITITKYRKKTA